MAVVAVVAVFSSCFVIAPVQLCFCFLRFKRGRSSELASTAFTGKEVLTFILRLRCRGVAALK